MQVVGTRINRKLLFSEKRLRTLLAVVNDLARLLQPIHMVRAKREEGGVASSLPALDGVEDAGGIIHHTIGIDGDGEALFTETGSYL